MDVDVPAAVARRGQRNEWGRERGDAGSADEQLHRHAAEQRRVGVEQKVVKRQPGQRDAQQVDMPAFVFRGIPVEILDQQDGADGEGELGGDLQREDRGCGGLQQQVEQGHPADYQQGDQAHGEECRRERQFTAEAAPIEVQDEAVPGGRTQQFEGTRHQAERRLPPHHDRERPGRGEQRGAGQIEAGAALLAPDQDQRGERGVQAGADAVEHGCRRDFQDHACFTAVCLPPKPVPVRRLVKRIA